MTRQDGTSCPQHLDGARVLFRAHGDFGIGINDAQIVALAIAHYDDSGPDEVYLFACDAQWNVIGDLLYSSVDIAQQDAERWYEVSPINWERVQDPDEATRGGGDIGKVHGE